MAFGKGVKRHGFGPLQEERVKDSFYQKGAKQKWYKAALHRDLPVSKGSKYPDYR